MIICGICTPSNLNSAELQILQNQLLLWTITSQAIYCPDFGNSIALCKILIMGQLTDERLLPSVYVTPSNSISDVSYERYIGHSYNTQQNKLACINPVKLQVVLNDNTKKPLVVSLADGTETIMQPHYIILHQRCPGIEVSYNCDKNFA